LNIIFKALLSESGDVSTVRLMSLLSLLVGMIIAIYGVYEGKDLSGVAQICGVFVGAAFAGKVTQKFAERS
jgi:hypothetical protein